MLVLTTLIVLAGTVLPMTTDAGKDAALEAQVRQMESFGIQVNDQMYAQMRNRMGIAPYTTGLAEHLVRLIPDRFIANMSKRKRKGKIYLDFLRNAKGATAIAAYSTRAKPGAPVSVPLTWDELSVDLRSDHFTVANVLDRLKRLRRDPWKDYFTVQQRLTSRMKRMLGMR